MAQAQGAVGRDKLPYKCRGRHPHLNAFDNECDTRPALIMMGASNLWFASAQSIIVMPRTDAENAEALGDRLRLDVSVDQIKQFAGQLAVIRAMAGLKDIDLSEVSDDNLAVAIADVLTPPESDEKRSEKLEVDAQFVGMVEIISPNRMRVEIDTAEIYRPDQTGNVAHNSFLG